MVDSAARSKIGALLLETGVVTKEQHDQAVAAQKEQGGELIDILFSLGHIDPQVVADFLQNRPSTVPIDFRQLELQPELVALLPAKLARKYEVVPIDSFAGALTLGSAAALPAEAVRELEDAVGSRVRTLRCHPEDVRTAIARYYPPAGAAERSAEGIEGPLRLSHVAHLVRRIDSLPALPETVHHVREAMQNPDTEVKDIVDLVTLDPPIAAKVLSVANSAAYGFSQQIHDLTFAVTLLGLHEIYAIVLSAAVVDLLKRWKHFDYRSFWLHSMCSAAGARVVAKACGRKRLAGIFTAGLLHDFGRAVLWEIAPQLCAKIDEGLTGRELSEAEERIVGLSHTEAGFELATHWNLPQELAEPIRFHHEPMKAVDAKEHVAVVSIASVLVTAKGNTLEENPDLFAGHEETLAYLGIDSELAEAMLDDYLRRREAALEDAF